MKKIKEKISATPVIESECCQKPNRCCKYFPVLAVIIAVAAIYAYYRFGIVATVNGKPISRLTYWQYLERLDKKETVKQMANEALVYQEAAKKGIVVSKEEIATEIASVEAEIKSQNQTLDAALTAEGMTRTDLEKQIALQKMVEKMSNPSVDITQTQVDEYLLKNKALIPTTYTKEQLQVLAKTQLSTEAKNNAIDTWFADLKKTAQIVIR
ncbi:MAG: SurA N-terminal domain-containing protein [Candidatus Shapirobacteria bacterium]